MPGLIADYQVKILDHDGNVVTIIDDWNSLEYELIHNDVGNHTISIQDHDARIEFFQLDYFVQIWRKPPGGTWYCDYDGFHRTPQHTVSETGLELFTAYGRHINDVLRRRTIFYFAGSPYTKKSGPVDDVMKAFVEENAGATALTNADRMRNILTAIHVPANESLGPNWEGERSFKKLLEVLQELGRWSTWRFYVDRDVDEEFGSDPKALVFRCYEKARELRPDFSGTPVTFSPELGNLRTPSYTLSRIDEIQAVVALGQGEAEDRVFLEELGDNVADAPYNDIEYAEDARQEELTAGLEVAALTVLADNGPQEALEFEVVQIPSCLYGVHYGLSDYVSAKFRGIQRDYRIASVKVSVSNGKETITARFQTIKHQFNLAPGDISSGPAISRDPLGDALKNLALRLHDLETREVFSGFTSGVSIPPTVQIPFDPTGTGLTGTTVTEILNQLINNAASQMVVQADLPPDIWVLPAGVGASAVETLDLTNNSLRVIKFDPGVDQEAWISVPTYLGAVPSSGMYVSIRVLGKAADADHASARFWIYGVLTADPTVSGGDFDIPLSGLGAFINTLDDTHWSAFDNSALITLTPTQWGTAKIRVVHKGSIDNVTDPVYVIGGSVFTFGNGAPAGGSGTRMLALASAIVELDGDGTPVTVTSYEAQLNASGFAESGTPGIWNPPTGLSGFPARVDFQVWPILKRPTAVTTAGYIDVMHAFFGDHIDYSTFEPAADVAYTIGGGFASSVDGQFNGPRKYDLSGALSEFDSRVTLTYHGNPGEKAYCIVYNTITI